LEFAVRVLKLSREKGISVATAREFDRAEMRDLLKRYRKMCKRVRPLD
jgi:hypothetical protein